MADVRLPSISPVVPEPNASDRYRIMRKGSRYNILGPHGRIFTKYQSASKAGPRWEELTRTSWPYKSTAHERGHRLWELGLIARGMVGRRHIELLPPKPAQPPSGVGRKVAVTSPLSFNCRVRNWRYPHRRSTWCSRREQCRRCAEIPVCCSRPRFNRRCGMKCCTIGLRHGGRRICSSC